MNIRFLSSLTTVTLAGCALLVPTGLKTPESGQSPPANQQGQTAAPGMTPGTTPSGEQISITPSPTASTTATADNTASASPTATASDSIGQTPAPTPTQSASTSATPTAQQSVTPAPTPTATPQPTPAPTPTPTQTPVATPQPTPSPTPVVVANGDFTFTLSPNSPKFVYLDNQSTIVEALLTPLNEDLHPYSEPYVVRFATIRGNVSFNYYVGGSRITINDTRSYDTSYVTDTADIGNGFKSFSLLGKDKYFTMKKDFASTISLKAIPLTPDTFYLENFTIEAIGVTSGATTSKTISLTPKVTVMPLRVARATLNPSTTITQGNNILIGGFDVAAVSPERTIALAGVIIGMYSSISSLTIPLRS